MISSSLGPLSTVCPQYMTLILSAHLLSICRSWLISKMVVLLFWLSRVSERIIYAQVVGSMALVGSSAISRRGWLARAMAIITFWHSPSVR